MKPPVANSLLFHLHSPRAPISANSRKLTRVAVASAVDSESRYRTTLTSLFSLHPTQHTCKGSVITERYYIEYIAESILIRIIVITIPR